MRRYCGLSCFGASRKIPREEKAKRKAEYDRRLRAERGEEIRTKKRAAYHATKDAKAPLYAEYRQKRREWQRAYARAYNSRPENRTAKRDYDRRYRSRKQFGDLWEAAYVTLLIDEQVKKRMSRYEIGLQNKTLNKALGRGRSGEVKRGYA